MFLTGLSVSKRYIEYLRAFWRKGWLSSSFLFPFKVRMDSYQRTPVLKRTGKILETFGEIDCKGDWALVRIPGMLQGIESLDRDLVTLQRFQAMRRHWRRSMVLRPRSKGEILWLKASCGSDMRKNIWADACLLRRHWNWDVLIPWYFVSSSELRHNLEEMEGNYKWKDIISYYCSRTGCQRKLIWIIQEGE